MTEKEIWDKAYKRIFELYGDMPDLRILNWYRVYYPREYQQIMAGSHS